MGTTRDQRYSRFLEMIELQKQLNSMSAGSGWCSGTTNEGRKIRWRLAASMEMSELIDSYPWKHWKSLNGEIDIQNAKVEAIDIFHFLLSEFIQVSKSIFFNNYEFKKYISTYIAPQLDRSFEAGKSRREEISHTASINDNGNEIDDIIDYFELFQSYIHNDEFDTQKGILDTLELCGFLGFDFNSLYSLYVGKNTLNIFRQQNGYKDGDYLKTWEDNKEDNVVMQEIVADLESTNNLSSITLLAELQYKYEQVLSSI